MINSPVFCVTGGGSGVPGLLDGVVDVGSWGVRLDDVDGVFLGEDVRVGGVDGLVGCVYGGYLFWWCVFIALG